MQQYFFLGGARDPEMQMIARIAEENDIPFVFASIDGELCHPGNAYRADPPEIPAGHQLVVVECEPTNFGDVLDAIRIDHHRPQDPGFQMGPEQFWEAASIGQIHCLLSIKPTREAKIMAAFDHCFPAAVRGDCPGITAEEVLSVKVISIVAGTGSTEEVVQESIAFFRDALTKAPNERVGRQTLKDLRGYHLGEGYSLDLLAAQVAVTMEGHAALLRHRDRTREPEKIIVTGHAEPETIQAFMDDWAPTHGLDRLYGVPARGYAGGYTQQ